MAFDFRPMPLQHRMLRSRRTAQLDDAEGTVISVERGCLWVTMENDSRDIVLTPGMRFEIDRSGRTLVTAEEDARFALLAPRDRATGIATWLARRLFAHRPAAREPGPRGAVPYY